MTEDRCHLWGEEVTQIYLGKVVHSCHASVNGLDGDVRKIDKLDLKKIPLFFPGSRGKWRLKNCRPYNHIGSRCAKCPIKPSAFR